MEDSLMNLKEAATYLNVSTHALRLWARTGKVAVVRLGRLYRFAIEDLDEFIARNRNPEDHDQISAAN